MIQVRGGNKISDRGAVLLPKAVRAPICRFDSQIVGDV
jgi:hypothetical protein